MSVSGQVSHLSWGTSQVTPAWSGAESSGRLVMISHYELRAVLSTWLISSSTLHWCRQRTVSAVSIDITDLLKHCVKSFRFLRVVYLVSDWIFLDLNTVFKGFQRAQTRLRFSPHGANLHRFYNVAASEIRFHTDT